MPLTGCLAISLSRKKQGCFAAASEFSQVPSLTATTRVARNLAQDGGRLPEVPVAEVAG